MAAPDVESIEMLLDDDVAALDDEQLKGRVRALVRLQARTDAALLAVTKELDQRNAYVADGMVSAKAWLAHHTGVARASAGAILWLGTRMRYMPSFARAMAQGSITYGHARLMARALSPRTLETFVRDEPMLLRRATELEADDFALVVARWAFLADPDGPGLGSDKSSELHVSPMLDGRHRIDGELDLEDSVEYLAELEARYEEVWQSDHSESATEEERNRTRSQRYAAAQVEMARRSSAADESGRGPRKPQIIVRVDVEALEGDPNGVAELEDGTALPSAVLQRWACDSSIGRVVMSGRSIPFDLGRATYTASDGQRRVLFVRDKGCIVPGCKRKARWCEAHHVVPWPVGPTNISNLVLLCKRHHKQVHSKVITIIPDEAPGTFIVTLRDGTRILERPPPTWKAA